jgi:hypothetical protein
MRAAQDLMRNGAELIQFILIQIPAAHDNEIISP